MTDLRCISFALGPSLQAHHSDHAATKRIESWIANNAQLRCGISIPEQTALAGTNRLRKQCCTPFAARTQAQHGHSPNTTRLQGGHSLSCAHFDTRLTLLHCGTRHKQWRRLLALLFDTTSRALLHYAPEVLAAAAVFARRNLARTHASPSALIAACAAARRAIGTRSGEHDT
jgi:hypothetical protein